MTLRTARLVIDRLVAADVDALVAYRNDPDVAADQAWPLPYPRAAADGLVAGSAETCRGGGQRAIRRAGDGALVGDLLVAPMVDAPHSTVVGVTLARAEWGRGYASEALTAVIDDVFLGGQTDRIAAYVFASNTRSQRLFERLGFRREGRVAMSYRRRDGTPTDEVLFGYPRSLWHRAGVELTADPHPADVERLHDELYEFNARAVGRHDGESLAIFERDDRGRIVAGLSGYTWAGIGHVDVLWVREDRRGQGWGRRLLEVAEGEMRRRGCRFAFLETHTFQAPELYPRLGYEGVGRRDDFPFGHGDLLLRKRL